MRGRPKKNDSRDKQYRVRLNNQEDKMLAYASEVVGKQKSEVFRNALEDYYNKLRLHEYAMQEEQYLDNEHIDLQRIIDCPYCGHGNRLDFTDECESWSEERSMGPEITYNFDLEDCYCEQCNKRFRVRGYVCEYPIGAYSHESIDVEQVERLDEDE